MNAARLIVLLMCASTICAAQQPGAATPTGKQGHVVVAANAMKWGPAPPGLPPGAQIAVLDGDPSQPGFFVMQIKVPDGYKVPPHWHPTDEHLVGLQGSLMVGTGEKFDKSGMHALTAGSYTKMPKEVRHFVWAKGETIFQVSAMGPFALAYVNPGISSSLASSPPPPFLPTLSLPSCSRAAPSVSAPGHATELVEPSARPSTDDL